MKKITFMLVFTLMSVLAHAQITQTYYVIDVSNGGHDTNNTGLQGSPLATIQGAIDKANGLMPVPDKLIIKIIGTLNHSSEINPDINMDIIGVPSDEIPGFGSPVLQGPGLGVGNANVLSKSIINIKSADGITVRILDLTVQDFFTSVNGGVVNLNGRNSKNITLEIDNCNFINNAAIDNAGGVINLGSSKSGFDGHQIKITKSYFEGTGSASNTSTTGACINLGNDTAEVLIENSTIRNFYATSKAGAIFVDEALSFTGVNLTIADNQCTANTSNQSAGIHFGAITTGAKLQNSILVNNTCTGASANPNLLIENNGSVTENNNLVGVAIDDIGFNTGLKVYTFSDTAPSVQQGNGSFLSEDVDQNGTDRNSGVSGTVDIGAWHSGLTPPVAAVADALNTTELKIYQSGTTVVVEAPDADNVAANVYSIVGAKVAETTISEGYGVIDTSALKSGVYVLELVVNGNKIAKKFIIQ